MRAALDPAGFRRELVRRGMSQGEFAQAASVTPATVSHAMSGRKVSYLTIRKFARVLTTTPTLLGTESILGTQQESELGGTTNASQPAL